MAGSIYRQILQSDGRGIPYNAGIDGIYSENTEIDTSTVAGQVLAYKYCNVVQDAIDIKARYHSSLTISAQKDTGDWIGGNYGTPTEKATAKKDLAMLAMFNENENFIQFNYRLKTNLHIFGKCYVWKQKIVGFDKYNYYIVPLNMVTPIYSTSIPKYDNYFKPIPDYYEIAVYNGTLKLYPDELFTFRDGIEGFSAYESTQSRLVALKEPISALLSANQMFTQLIADGGARGIIGQGAKDNEMLNSPFLDEEKARVHKELKGYGKLRGQLKYIVTRGQVTYTPLTSSISDMQLPQNLLNHKINVYRGFLIPNAFASNEGRFKVMPEARKELFTGSIIPEANDIFGSILKMKNVPIRDWEYKPDYSSMDFFQESLLQAGTALQQAANAVVPLVRENIWDIATANSELTPYKR